MITPIDQLGSITRLRGNVVDSATTIQETKGSFESIFRSLMDNVKETSRERETAEYLLATGQLDNPAALMIASSKYTIAVDLLVQLRSRALEAYNELTRINL